MSLRIVVSSEDGNYLFSNNEPFNFRVKLNQRIQLDGYWVVAVTEFSTTERRLRTKTRTIYLFRHMSE